MPKLIRGIILAVLVLLVTGAAGLWHVSKTPGPSQGAFAEPIPANLDLTGDWTTKPDAKLKFVAEIQAGTITMHIVTNGDSMAYYYGSFSNPTPGKPTVVSKKIDDGKFNWSNAVAKDFLYQNGSLIFDYEAFGIKTTIELVKEK